MKRDTLCAIAASALVWLIAFPTNAADKGSDKTDFAIFAICRVEQHVEVPGGNRRITIESGMGDGGFPVTTTSRSAQQWFDYGIKLFHAFYHDDVKLAFDKAVAADPGCAMCLWGQALSRGPTANFDVPDEDLKSGLDAAQKALAVAHMHLGVRVPSRSYAMLISQVRTELVAAGFDPSIGFAHRRSWNPIPLVYDLMEPLRPVVDRKVLEFALAHTFSPGDFTISNRGGCRLNSQMARVVAREMSGIETNTAVLFMRHTGH